MLRAAGAYVDGQRLISLALDESTKHPDDWVRGARADVRRACAVVYDPHAGTTRECRISLDGGRDSMGEDRIVSGVQPAFVGSEYSTGWTNVLGDMRVREALGRRGVTDLDLAHVELWPFGHAVPPELSGRRVAWCAFWRRDDATDNPYAHPIAGLDVIYDMASGQVVRVADHGVVDVPEAKGRWVAGDVGAVRPSGASLEITQAGGPGFRRDGWALEWEAWHLRIGFHPREGLTLHTLAFDERPICYRASIAELVIPYADGGATAYTKSAFDIGEIGIGPSVNVLERGCDCLGEIDYLDAHLATDAGEIVTFPHAICVHEEDHGILWKHVDARAGTTEVRRSRRLVISSFVTVDNYEYGFYWYLYRDGIVEFEAKLTGIVLTAASSAGTETPHGTQLAPGLNAMYHQHFFCARLDMDVDGGPNTVSEVHSEALGDSFTQVERALLTEDEDAGLVDPLSGRYWRITNEARRNVVGGPTGYKLVPGANIRSFTRPESGMGRRIAFCERHLWVTPYNAAQRWPAGDYPNLNPASDGLPRWTEQGRCIEDADIVCWYVFGAHHVPRLEDWPVMPVERIGFALKPDGFFNRNPGINLPREDDRTCGLAPHAEGDEHAPASGEAGPRGPA